MLWGMRVAIPPSRLLRPDPYIFGILAMVVLASLLPISGRAAKDFAVLTKIVIGMLFFLHGARLSREAIIAGITHWRLHLTVLTSTFALFPLLGLAMQSFPVWILPPALAAGVLFLCCLPSTVQSSIAFTAVARGNVAAAVCAASASNFIGIFITPLLVAVLMSTKAAGVVFSFDMLQSIAVQLLLPFTAGQAARRWIGDVIAKHSKFASYFDRGSILLVVYGAFSEAVTQGLWAQVSSSQVAWLALFCCALLAIVLSATVFGARAMGFSVADEITIVFCGSKKSLASGVPMATIFFPLASVGLMVLPLMLFHQIQLMACAVIAQRYAGRQFQPA